MGVDILTSVLYLLCRSEERIKKCGRDELPARSTAVRAVPRPKSVLFDRYSARKTLMGELLDVTTSPEVRESADCVSDSTIRSPAPPPPCGAGDRSACQGHPGNVVAGQGTSGNHMMVRSATEYLEKLRAWRAQERR